MADQANDNDDPSVSESEWDGASEIAPNLIEELSNEEFFDEEPGNKDVPGLQTVPDSSDDKDMPDLQQVSDSSDEEDPPGPQPVSDSSGHQNLVEGREPEDDDLLGLDRLSDSDEEDNGPRDSLEVELEKL